MSNYHSQKACKDTDLYHAKTKAHFIIFGTCEQRIDRDEKKYVLNLHSSVIHRYLPEPEKNSLLFEMESVFPHEILIPKSNEYDGFKVASETIGFSSKHIMGLASLNSYDPFTSLKIHYSLFIETKEYIKIRKNIFVENIKALLPDKIAIECQMIMRHFFNKTAQRLSLTIAV